MANTTKTNTTTATGTVVGYFRDMTAANDAVQRLVDFGVPRNDISVVASRQDAEQVGGKYAEQTSGTGEVGRDVGKGAAIGGGLGLIAGLVALAIPGVGPVIAAGPIAAALTGLGVGAAAGCGTQMEQAVVWFSFKAVVIGGLLLVLAVSSSACTVGIGWGETVTQPALFGFGFHLLTTGTYLNPCVPPWRPARAQGNRRRAPRVPRLPRSPFREAAGRRARNLYALTRLPP